MPCRPSTSTSRTLRPPAASASASAAATVVLPVPPLPVTTCRRTPSQSVSLALTRPTLIVRSARTYGRPGPPGGDLTHPPNDGRFHTAYSSELRPVADHAVYVVRLRRG